MPEKRRAVWGPWCAMFTSFVYNLEMCYVHEPLRQFETQDLSMAQSDSCKHAQELVESVLHQ